MRIKGTALLARRKIISEQFGEAAWATLFQDMAKLFPSFNQPVLATTLIPMAAFLALHDELVQRFFHGQDRAYFSLGEQSARWAITEGPYKNFIADRDFAGFVEFFPRTWSTYFQETSSYCTTSVTGTSVEFEVFDLPVWHPYFEYFIVGYLKGALELICGNSIGIEKVRGGSRAGYRYILWVPGPHDDPIA